MDFTPHLSLNSEKLFSYYCFMDVVVKDLITGEVDLKQ